MERSLYALGTSLNTLSSRFVLKLKYILLDSVRYSLTISEQDTQLTIHIGYTICLVFPVIEH
jgi:hypothetical protein